jgi:DNA-binding transcriptional ArsR family regulator
VLRIAWSFAACEDLRNSLAEERIMPGIRFHLPAEAPERIEFAYSPLLETVLSLHVVVAPKHHPLQHPWVRRARRLSPVLRREIMGFRFAYRMLMPDFVYPEADGFGSFADELARLRALDPELAAFEFMRPLYDHGGVRDPAKLRDPAIRVHVERRVSELGGDPETAPLMFDDPAALLERFAALLEAYWDEAFAAEWERLEPRLADAVTESGRLIASEGIYALLTSLWPQLRVDPQREEFGLDVPHHHDVEITEDRPLVLVPSAYVWPHVRVNCDEPWPAAVIYPAPFVFRDARRRIPDAELLRVLRALADDTRLRALKLIAERPRSTQELAPLVGISEAGLSKHLRILAAAGVLEARRDGYYVLYSLVRERVEPLAETVLSFRERSES